MAICDYMVGVLFIIGCVIFYFYTTNQSNKKHLEGKIKKLENDKFWTDVRIKSLEGELQKKDKSLQNNEGGFEEDVYTSEREYNDAIDEIEKSIKYSPLERIYYETELPDQLRKEVRPRIKTQEHLKHLYSRGVSDRDIQSAKEIVALREEILEEKLDLRSFTEDYINEKGKYLTEEVYLGLVKIFELAGRDISKSDEVYKALFEDLLF